MTREVNELKKKLKDSFPLTAAYSQDKLTFAERYIVEIRKWAAENLGVDKYE